ncbi:arginine-specific demethylase JMJ20-like [Malus sylvestris]|uniref:arginine-specific demethylase JMJ20-like n=1 Tax=Malus sylvestris TaxID=3752 RepID=UPI0021AD42B7|nr:arginine-specific demethylase JMJ20-like [Malus sylvestris]
MCGKKRWILISPFKVIVCLAATFTCNNSNQLDLSWDILILYCSDERSMYFSAYPTLALSLSVAKSCVHNISGDVSETNVPGFVVVVVREDRISINHNWFNAYNLHWVLSGTLLQWDWLLREYYEAKEYIEDIKDICDLKVSANATLPLIQVISDRSHGFHLDFRETLTDPEFFKLNTDLGSIYGMVHMQPDCSCDTKKAWLDDMRDMDIVGVGIY